MKSNQDEPKMETTISSCHNIALMMEKMRVGQAKTTPGCNKRNRDHAQLGICKTKNRAKPRPSPTSHS